MAIATSLQEIRQLTLDRHHTQNLSQQLYMGLRNMMLGGQLPSGSQLPSSRNLAEQLNLGRNTVIAAYEQLQAEGYIISKRGSGSFVASPLPDQLHSPLVDAKPEIGVPKSGATPKIHKNINDSFCVGVPDLAAFPHKTWQRIQQQLQKHSADFMAYGDEAGFWPLRRAIAQYLQQSRAVKCHGGQVLITSGAQQALDLCIRLLLGPDDVIAMESPGYRGVMRALQHSGKKHLPCRVDQDGLDLQTLIDAETTPNLVYTTPANQYPMGVVLSLERKMALLHWAQTHQSWIIEDDYDSEYHYQYRPLASMQGLDPHQRVIYLGSFSKTLYPGLRLGYLVLPDSLIERFTAARIACYGQPPLMTQAQVASFIEEGHFYRHLRRMRIAYKDKLTALQQAMTMLEPWGKTLQRNAGMHIVFVCYQNIDDHQLVQHLEAQGIFSSPLSEYCHGNESLKGLVLGFANTAAEKMLRKISVIRTVLETLYPTD
ncbi:PLP-dependent aminotransferase family protein [Pseudoteredinibacter isoporae]|uniref:MocR-like pyridoxine biosynthesis transcription factor PdxR n=1 Tax=Pseudoteredinibacter isoporae TaxID=570281 RepID=UPI00310C05D1